MNFKNRSNGSLLARSDTRILLLFLVAFFTQLLFIDGPNNLLAGEKRKTFEERFPPKKAPMTAIEEAEARKLLKSGRPITKFREGVVTADTFHTAGSTYDYGWNGLTRQLIVTDTDGNQHITFHRRTTLSSGATRRIYYQYEIDNDDFQVGVDVTQLGQGSGFPWIDLTSDDRAVITWHSGLVDRIIVDQAPGFGFFNVKPHPLDPSQNPLFASLAVDKSKDRLYWWSAGATYTAFGDSQPVYFTENYFDDSWDSTNIVWDMTNTGSYWSGSAITISHDDSKLAIWQRYDAIPMDGDTADCIVYALTKDEGDTWDITCVIKLGVSWNGVSDPIITPFGYNDTLIIHAARGVDLGFDYQNNVHMLLNGLAYHATNDSETVNTTGIYHYSSLRGEGASNLVEITDANTSHAAFIDSAINAEGRWTGNGAGFNMPTIASARDAPIHFALWVQWNGTDEGNLAALIADTGATGFFTSAIWGAWSFDGGDSWDPPYEVASVPGASLEFVTLDPWLEKIDSLGNYRWHALWLEDLSPGVSLFGQGDSSMNPWIYGTDTLRYINVAVQGENAIPNKFTLSDNYPNPFNPVTTIEYSLPKSGDVTLIIYNVLGKEVARIVDEFQPAGEYNAIWNASNISSGIYFYRLSSGVFTETKKMVLLK